MKIIISFLLLLLSLAGYSQKIKRSSDVVNIEDARLFSGKNFGLPVYPDTATANIAANIGMDSCGTLIFIRSDNKIYKRGCSPKRWIEVAGSGTGPGTETDPIYSASSWFGTTNNSSNWNTAFGWGNHASAGYLNNTSGDARYPQLSGSYNNPSWLNQLAWSKITGAPSFLTSYTETDPVWLTDKPSYLTSAAAAASYADIAHTHTFSSITSKPTTLSGYGITDAASISHTHTFSSITSKPTTLSGYGITDAVAKVDSTGSTGYVTRKALTDTLSARTRITYLLADTSSSSLTALGTGLKFSIAANQVFRVVVSGTASKATSTTGLKLAIGAPTGCVIKGIQQQGQAAVSTAMQNSILSAINSLGSTFATGNGVEVPFRQEFVVVNGSNAGEIELQFATVTSNVATIYAYTQMMYTRIN